MEVRRITRLTHAQTISALIYISAGYTLEEAIEAAERAAAEVKNATC